MLPLKTVLNCFYLTSNLEFLLFLIYLLFIRQLRHGSAGRPLG